MRIGATPKKLALIAILAVVWVAVIVRNFGGAASESSDELGPRRVGGVRTELVLQPASKREDWTQPELEATQRVDPLAGINSAAAPESEVVGAEPTRATSEVIEKRPSKSRPGQGIVTWKHQMLNQREPRARAR